MYKNKWNGRTYQLKDDQGSTVTLIRDDGSSFVIEKKEFKFSYKKLK